jgi:hypothetical protein
MHDTRLYLAVTGARRRIREQRMEPEHAAQATSNMLDVPSGQVLRLAIAAENGCAEARLTLRTKEPSTP